MPIPRLRLPAPRRRPCRLAGGARALAGLGAVADPALRRGPRLRRQPTSRRGRCTNRRRTGSTRRGRCCGRTSSLGANAGEVKAYLDNSPNPSNTSYGVTITGRQPILNQSNRTTIAQSERSLVSSLADLDAAEQDLMLRVSQAYFDVLGAQDTLATTRASKAAIAEQLASAKRNFEVGTATITDTREAQARFDLATAQEIAAENDLRDQADRPRPAGRPEQRRAEAAGGAGGAAAAQGRRRGVRLARRRRASGGAPGAGRLRGGAARDREGARPGPADRRRRRLGRQRPRPLPAGRHSARPPASACSSTCRSTPAARSRTGSRRRWCSRSARATTSRRRAAASPRRPARPTTRCSRARPR